MSELSRSESNAPEPAAKPSLARVLYGSCLCGDVGYRISGAPLRMVNCHCENCRRARSAAFATAFCRRCGSDLPRVTRGESVVVVPAGSLDGDPGIRPQAHVCVSEKASWYEITDDLPQYAQGPPAV